MYKFGAADIDAWQTVLYFRDQSRLFNGSMFMGVLGVWDFYFMSLDLHGTVGLEGKEGGYDRDVYSDQ